METAHAFLYFFSYITFSSLFSFAIYEDLIKGDKFLTVIGVVITVVELLILVTIAFYHPSDFSFYLAFGLLILIHIKGFLVIYIFYCR